MLLLEKTFNNSAAICIDEKRHEYLVMGKGIVFGKNQYDEIDVAKCARVIPLDKNAKRSKLETMVSEIPYEYFEIVEEIKAKAEKALNSRLDDGLLIRLTDHVYFSVEKEKRGVKTPNLILEDIHRFYPREYAVGEDAVNVINSKFGVKLDKAEVGFIAFHIASSEGEGSNVDFNEVVDDLTNITGMIEEYFHVHLDEQTIEYSRLITHLKFFILSMHKGNSSERKSLKGDSLYEMLCNSYQDINRFMDVLNMYTESTYSYTLQDTDRMYLMIHLARIIK